MTLAQNRYLNELKSRDPKTHAVPPHLLPADDGATMADEDLSRVNWLNARSRAFQTGFRVNKNDVSLPRSAWGEKHYLRIGHDGNRLILILSLEMQPGAHKRRGDGAAGGAALISQLHQLGWTKGEYRIEQRPNCWIVTKELVK